MKMKLVKVEEEDVLDSYEDEADFLVLEKFGDTQGAIVHLEKATGFKPDELEPKQLAANLYLQVDDGADRALAAYKTLVQAQPRDIATLQQLRKKRKIIMHWLVLACCR